MGQKKQEIDYSGWKRIFLTSQLIHKTIAFDFIKTDISSFTPQKTFFWGTI